MTRARRKEMVIPDVSPPVPTPADVIARGLPALVPDRNSLAITLLSLVAEADKAVQAATELEVTDQKSYEVAADVGRSIQTVITKADTDRKAITKPFDDAKKAVMKFFEKPVANLTAALDSVKRKENAWRVAEEQRRREEERQRRDAEAAEAQRLAEAAAAMGDKTGAAQIVAEAEERAATPIEVKVSGHGSFGGSAVGTKRPVGEVTDMPAFLAWVLTERPNGILNSIEIPKSILNQLAKTFLESGESREVPGFAYKYDTNTQFR